MWVGVEIACFAVLGGIAVLGIIAMKEFTTALQIFNATTNTTKDLSEMIIARIEEVERRTLVLEKESEKRYGALNRAKVRNGQKPNDIT